MPEISRFYGIIIRMYYNDHLPPHFHAQYAEHEILVNIDTLGVLTGTFPTRALGLVAEWASVHQDDLKGAWEKARRFQPLDKIAPLE